jgi:signal transduction histidine kinase
VVVFRDISARFREDHERAQLLAREHDAHLEAEAQRERLETLFMQAPVAICLTRGEEHVVELVNPLGQILVGERLSVGRSVRETVSGLDPNLLHLLEEVYRKGTPFVGHEVPLRADFSGTGQHEVKYFDLTWQPWRGVGGEILGTMGLCAEVTEQVLARREVEALATDLQRALQIRDDFLSVASHELKTPLTSLQLHLQGLMSQLRPGTRPLPAERLSTKLESANLQTQRMGKLVNELLDISRIAQGNLLGDLEPVDLVKVVRGVVERSRDGLARAECSLRLHLAPSVVGRWDAMRLEQVVLNLLTNAMKYGAGQPIDITVGADATHARLVVRDEGIGIAQEDTERIFERFERAVSVRHYGGFGIGLWIVREIVQALGGGVEVHSVPGQGAAFTVLLPLEGPKSRPVSGAPALSVPGN